MTRIWAVDRPSGTVTSLFTDIEGSTRLWEQNPDVMAVTVHELMPLCPLGVELAVSPATVASVIDMYLRVGRD
jgi:hypothetical protein